MLSEKNLFLVCFGSILFACGGASKPAETYPEVAVAQEHESREMPAEAPVAAAPPASSPAPAAPTLMPAAHTPISGKMPTVKIVSPKPNAVIPAGKVMFEVDAKNWPLSPTGSHLHLILDNEPYIALRDVSGPIDLVPLIKAKIGNDLSAGTHVLRIFPGREHHESVKDADAFAVVVFHYKQKSLGFKFNPKAPLLTYSRPKDCVALGERLLLDFFVSNVPGGLGPNKYRVRYDINGILSGELTDWVPYYVENLPAGETHFRLQLIGPNGSPVPGIFNDTTRSITISHDCAGASMVTHPKPDPLGEHH